jgi:S-adenosylmethionine:tRNA-ribosyltransferase-isomerase (queuine synthetase)
VDVERLPSTPRLLAEVFEHTLQRSNIPNPGDRWQRVGSDLPLLKEKTMAGKSSNQELLMKIAEGQAVLMTEVKTLNTRLFGGDGQVGSIPFLFQKHEEVAKELQTTKEKIKEDVDAEIEKANTKITELDKKSSLVLWRTGLISSLGGSAIGIGITMLFNKIFKVH